MQNESKDTAATEKTLNQSLMINVLKIIDEKMFRSMPAADVNEILDMVYTDWLTSENADDSGERGKVIVAVQLMKKLLKSIGSHQDPDNICTLEIRSSF